MALVESPPTRLQGDTGICGPTTTPHAEAMNRLSGLAGYSIAEP
jgi:hypothetical protein